MSDIELHKYKGDSEHAYQYQGLVIHAGPGIHEYMCDYMRKNFSNEQRILVLGAGTGAFDARIFEHGFHDITSVDVNPDNYQYQNSSIDFKELDLNGAFSEGFDQKFDVIVAIELIEHLHSTANFLRNCKPLLASGGSLVVSTPNPRSYLSRLKFAFTGYHKYFEGVPPLYEHINPIHIDILRHHCYFQELEVREVKSFNVTYRSSLVKKVIRNALFVVLWAADRFINHDLINEKHNILFLRLSHKDI